MDTHVIIGANYGDEGKGTVTALIAKEYGNTLNVMTNGGAQRGHSILTPDGYITYQHFGSGTYCGADTFYCSQFILNPMQFAKEWEALLKKPDNVFRDPKCLWTTPWDMMANRIEGEQKKSFASCGMGIWNTIRRSKKVYMPFDKFMSLTRKEQELFLRKVRAFYENHIDFSSFWRRTWYDYDIEDHFLKDCRFMREHTVSGTITQLLAMKSLCTNNYDNIVFENGQGLLLKDTGRDTYDTTPSDTGATYALEIIGDLKNSGLELDPVLHYVTRPYLTRHGDGHLKDQQDRERISQGVQEDRTNHWNSNQGEFRYGNLDINDLKDRIEEDACGHKYILEVTHCDEMDRSSEFGKAFEEVHYIDTPLV